MPLSKKKMRELKRLKRAVLKSEAVSILNSAPVVNPKMADAVEPEHYSVYDPRKHKPGDKVLLGGRLFIVPELDADGQPIPKY